MTSGDYKRIANIIREVGEDEALCMDSGVDRVRLAHQFVAVLKQHDPRLNADNFIIWATTGVDRAEYEEADGHL